MEILLWGLLVLCLAFIVACFVVLGIGIWQTYQYNKIELVLIQQAVEAGPRKYRRKK